MGRRCVGVMAAVAVLGVIAWSRPALAGGVPQERRGGQKAEVQLQQALIKVAERRAAVLLTWRRHLADNKRKIATGETGRLVVDIALRPGSKEHSRVRFVVREPMPDGVRPAGGLVVAEHFVDVGMTGTGQFVVDDIPTGLELIVEISPVDGSAPVARSVVKGPADTGDEVRVDASLELPYPVLTGRILNAAGLPLASRTVAVEILRGGCRWHEQIVTDEKGRFRVRVRAGSGEKRETGQVLVVPGELRRSGGRIYTTDLPFGHRARAAIRWPCRGETALGDLRLPG